MSITRKKRDPEIFAQQKKLKKSSKKLLATINRIFFAWQRKASLNNYFVPVFQLLFKLFSEALTTFLVMVSQGLSCQDFHHTSSIVASNLVANIEPLSSTSNTLSSEISEQALTTGQDAILSCSEKAHIRQSQSVFGKDPLQNGQEVGNSSSRCPIQ